jgi:DHA2 family multidrug resistance protein
VTTPQAQPEIPPPTLAIWLGFACMCVGNFMSVLDIQIVASSIREIQAGVAASADELVWIQTSYLVAEVIAIPLSGFLGRALTIRRLFAFAALGFTLFSAACAIAWSIESLIVFRAIQGLFGGFMIPTTFAAAFMLFPERNRATVNVLIGLIVTLAPSIGPTVGGWITATFGWHWLFLVNLAPGLMVTVGVWLLLKPEPMNWPLLRRFDFLGLAGMAVFLGALQVVLEEGPRKGWLDSPEIAGFAIAAVAGAALFFQRALTRPEPVVSLAAFSNREFAISCALAFALGIGLYGSVYLQPLFLGQIRGYDSLQIGHVMFVTGATMFFSAPVARQIAMRLDPRVAIGFGISLVAGGCFLQASLTAESSFWAFFWPQALRGMGFIFCFATLSIVALGTLSQNQIQAASGVFNLMRNLGGAIGLALLNTVRDWYTVFHKTELAPMLDPANPLVADMLAGSAARLAAAGVGDPEAAAIAQYAALLNREAAVMTFNNLFTAMGASFIFAVMLLPLVRPPKPAAGAPVPDAH